LGFNNKKLIITGRVRLCGR